MKLRTDAWQTPVSMLGKMLRMTRLPAKSFSEASLRSVLVRVKSGAAAPTGGSWPDV
ncbi:hypothetical protein D3C87_1977260 [compost metagenome]